MELQAGHKRKTFTAAVIEVDQPILGRRMTGSMVRTQGVSASGPKELDKVVNDWLAAHAACKIIEHQTDLVATTVPDGLIVVTILYTEPEGVTN